MAYTTADSGNGFVYNYGRNPAVSFNFMLRVEGVIDLPCRAVKVFHRENEYELIQEGGLNDYVHMRRKPISKPFTIQVERYVGTDILDPLANGTDLVLPLILYVSQYGIYNGPFLPIRMYLFTGCTVMGKEYGELNAEKSGLLTETTTIAYREMLCVENVAASYLQSDYWKFEKNSNAKKGDESTPRRARHYKTSYLKADGTPENIEDDEVRLDMAAEAAERNMWRFSGKKKYGNSKTNAAHPEDLTKKDQGRDLKKASEEAEKNQWHFDGKKKYGNSKMNAAHPEDLTKKDKDRDLEKAQKAAEQNLWPPKRNAVDVAAFLAQKNKQ